MSYSPVPAFDQLKLSIQSGQKHRASLIAQEVDGHYYQYFGYAPRTASDAQTLWHIFRVEYYDAGGEDGEAYRESQDKQGIAWSDRANAAHWIPSGQ